MKRRGLKVMALAEILLASDMGPSPTGIGAIRVGADYGKTVVLNEAQRAAAEKRLRKMKGKTHAVNQVPNEKVPDPCQSPEQVQALLTLPSQHHELGAQARGSGVQEDRQPRPVSVANG